MGFFSDFARTGAPRKANGKIDYRPRRHHGWTLFIMILGFLLPPLAVAARFGIGKDFFINVVLTICGYFPGHGHNFFIQNIRDNTNKKRNPKWAVRYGLVDDTAQKQLAKSRGWVGRYNDQMPSRTMYDEDGNEVVYDRNHRFEDGDGPAPERAAPDHTLTEQDRYYRDNSSSSMGDPYSLRRSGSTASSSHNAGTAARREAKNKSKARGLLGRKKSDRHAKTDEVMGDPDLIDGSAARRNNRGDHGDGFGGSDGDSSSLDGGRRSNGRGYDDIFADGPEDADARYKPSSGNSSRRQDGPRSNNGYGASDSLSSSKRTPAAANDGLDHTF